EYQNMTEGEESGRLKDGVKPLNTGGKKTKITGTITDSKCDLKGNLWTLEKSKLWLELKTSEHNNKNMST
ncbi:hypothetical protein ACJX0J_033636, partial [Zea mays]